jgi:predicted RND superfamily exporter protein
MSPSFSQRYADYIVNNPWRLLLLSIIVLFVMASGGRFLDFSNDYREFFSAGNPELLAFDEMQNTYNKADNVMFVLAPEKGDVFSRETLRLVTEVTNKSWQIPYSSRVDSISNYQHTVADAMI